MLVLSRRLGECIHIGPGLRVSVLRLDRGRVLLGVEAPIGSPEVAHRCGPHDQIPIGPGIRVVVGRIDGPAVRLAVEAPAAVRIIRSELLPPLNACHARDHRWRIADDLPAAIEAATVPLRAEVDRLKEHVGRPVLDRAALLGMLVRREGDAWHGANRVVIVVSKVCRARGEAEDFVLEIARLNRTSAGEAP